MPADASPLRSPRSYSYDNNQFYGPWQDGKDLGKVSFTLSESVPQSSKDWFLTGLKLLHAFEYPEARRAFNKARQASTDKPFIMAIWGELMCSYQILWYSRQFDTADSLLSELNSALGQHDGTLNDSESALIEAARKLFAVKGRDLLPSQSGSNVQEFYLHLDTALADNDSLESEVKVFHLLSKLATRNGITDFSLETDVITGLQTLLGRSETADHPGLHHYMIHAAESPFLATTALQAVYPSVTWLQKLNTAPKNTSSIHLTHMPAHFFFARGDWVRVADINLDAWNKSLLRKTELNTGGSNPPLTDASLAFHEHLWRVYALLQQGLWGDAWSTSEDLYNRMTALQNSGSSASDLASMKTYYAYEKAYLELGLPAGHAAISTLQARTLNETGMSAWGLMAARFINAWEALQQQDYTTAASARTQFVAIQNEEGFNLYPANIDALPIMEQQLLAEESRQKGNIENAIQIVNAVTDAYARMRWDHGVPIIVKPVYEYLGELYLQGMSLVTAIPYVSDTGSPPSWIKIITQYDTENAMMAFQKELNYFPRRRQTLEGMLIASAAHPNQHKKIQANIDNLNSSIDFDSMIAAPPCQAGSPGLRLIPAMLVILPVMLWACSETTYLPASIGGG